MKKVGVGLVSALLTISLYGCIDLGGLAQSLEDMEELQSGKGGGNDHEDEYTTYHGYITNPTGMLQREAEASGAYCVALNSTLNVIAIVETGETVVSAVGPDGYYTLTVESFMAAVMIVFVIDLDSDGDMDLFEGTLMFSTSYGLTSQITTGGGDVNLGTTTLSDGINETSSLSGSLLSDLDADADGISDFADVDDNEDGEADLLENENDEDNDGIPDLFENNGYDEEEDEDCDNDGVSDDVDVNIEITIQIDFSFSFDQN